MNNFFEFILLIACIFFIEESALFSQNTVGLISIDVDEVSEGYNLIYPHNQPNVYLLNKCGEVVHSWEDSLGTRPGNMAYLSEEGLLYKCKAPKSTDGTIFFAGGAGGIIEVRDWDNNLLWRVDMIDSVARAHHDIAVMPNGNVLVIAWEGKSVEEVVANGRDTSLFNDDELWPDFIREYNPFEDSIVWEWHAWDHLIQDFDSSKLNYGVVSDHPELIDINYDLNGNSGRHDWLHMNSIDYNERKDQILVSVPFFDEIWIIDHSTTTNEAKGGSGGNSHSGGDLMFRWGNPRTYKNGTIDDRQLFFQHDAKWVDDHIDSNHNYFGRISLFNNRISSTISTANILNPDFNIVDNKYEQNPDGSYFPMDFDMVIYHPDTIPMYSSGLSGIQVLENNNVLITSGRNGYSFELNPENDLVWEYITPLLNGERVAQGEVLRANNNVTFRVNRYPINYPAFDDKDLSAKGFIELAPNTDFCKSIVTASADWFSDERIEVFPNPSIGPRISVRMSPTEDYRISLNSLDGRVLQTWESEGADLLHIDIATYHGLFFLHFKNNKGETFIKKIIITN